MEEEVTVVVVVEVVHDRAVVSRDLRGPGLVLVV